MPHTRAFPARCRVPARRLAQAVHFHRGWKALGHPGGLTSFKSCGRIAAQRWAPAEGGVGRGSAAGRLESTPCRCRLRPHPKQRSQGDRGPCEPRAEGRSSPGARGFPPRCSASRGVWGLGIAVSDSALWDFII